MPNKWKNTNQCGTRRRCTRAADPCKPILSQVRVRLINDAKAGAHRAARAAQKAARGADKWAHVAFMAQVGAGQMMLNTAVVQSALLAALNFWSVTLSFGHVIDPSLVLAVVNGEGVEFPEVTPAAQVE